MMFVLDGIQWNVGCTVERTAEITASEISGMLMDKSYFNDVIGTFMKYDIRLEVPFGREDFYNSLYEELTNPIDGHTLTVPYGGGVMNITGRIETVSDVYVRMANNTVHWKGVKFSVIANHPTKTYTLGQAIARGFTPLPDESTVDVGAVYQYSVNGWVEIDDADDYYY